jgi:genome maintenance exonuclease 1
MTGLPPRFKVRRLRVGGERFYEVDGVLYPSVTTVLSVVAKPNLVAWARRTVLAAVRELLANGADVETALTLAEREPERVRDTAAQRGSSAHGAIALALSGRDYPREMAPWVEAALGFLEDHGLSLLASEQVLVSRRHGYAGTCDVATVQADGGLTLVDWKTGGIWPEHALQLGAYGIALEEMTGQPVAAAYVVSLRGGHAEAKQVDLAEACPAFLATLALWRATQAGLWTVGGRGVTGGAAESLPLLRAQAASPLEP